jgi:hypothetical protein
VEVFDQKANTWTVVASMNTAHYAHTATLLPNGKILITGGYDGSNYIPSAEVYDPELNTWTVVASMSNGRYVHTATLLPSGKVLVVGGYDGSNYLSSVEMYDPELNTWTTVASLNIIRYYHTATLLPNGKVLVTGGFDGINYLSAAEVYDPGTDSWMTIAPMKSKRYVQTATLLLNGKVLITGGFTGSNYLASTELYDPGLGFDNAWRPTISSISSPLKLGDQLSFNGSGFRGYQFSEASGGGSFNSATNYPLVQIRRVDNEQWLWALPKSFNSTSYTSLPITDFQEGPVFVTVFVNGIPSVSKLLVSPDFFYLPIVTR